MRRRMSGGIYLRLRAASEPEEAFHPLCLDAGYPASQRTFGSRDGEGGEKL